MKIQKYKYLGNGKYKVFIGEENYIIYEDIILKYNILSKDQISEKDLDLYLKDNQFYEAYYKAVSYINIKLRSEKEVYKYLIKDFPKNITETVISKLNKDGYLNEDVYAEAYINDQINLKTAGPIKIKHDLIELGISESVINNHIEIYDKGIQEEKIKKFIEKAIKLNNNKSVFMLKNKIHKDLINKGFYNEDISYYLENYNFDDSEIYKKEYKRIYNKLSKKYDGKELEYKIKEKLYQKGFRD